MMYWKENTSLKRKLKYIFFIALIAWCLLSIPLIFQYLKSTSKKNIYKGWTFVEGIFTTTSILPYLNQSNQWEFYQGMLFKSCLSIHSTGSDIIFNDELCHVTTDDYKTYYVSVFSWNIRSDGVPVVLEDVFFTYNDILSHNTWKIWTLQKYTDIDVSQTTDGRLKIIFPQQSIDNTIFFKNYILPRHILNKFTLTQYQHDFAINPVYTRCASVMPQSTDQFSLIFDLADCEDTHLWFYQIKDTISFQDFENAISVWNSIVEFYEYPSGASWYVEQKLWTNNLVTLFFNTKSKKTRVRVRRALWWLIKHNFYIWDNQEYIKKSTEELFSYYASTWANIKSFMEGITNDDTVSKQSLLDSNIKQLPTKITITGTNQKLVYFVEDIKSLLTVEFKFDKSYDKVSIQHDKWAEYFPKSYSKTKKSTKYNIGPTPWNLNPWLNKYTIYGRDKKEKKVIAILNLYNLKWQITSSDLGLAPEDQKLLVLYYREPVSMFVIERLKKIFTEFDIINYFTFQWVDTAKELEWKLTMWDYDIVINTINMWFKKDFSKLFSTTDPKDNHSQYVNDRFVSLLQQYLTSNITQKGELLSTVNNIYQNDMPFVILWNAQKSLYVKPSVREKLDINWVELFDYNRRDIVYERLRLVENVSIDLENIWNIGDFFKFIFDSIKIQRDSFEETISNKEDNQWTGIVSITGQTNISK